MIKIVLLASGKSYHATRWANALSERGIQVTFITIHKVVRPLNENINIIYINGYLGKLSYLSVIPKIRKLIKKEKPNIVHAHTAGGYGFIGLNCGFNPWIVSLYGQDIFYSPHRTFIHKLLINKILLSANKILSTSKTMADKAIKTYPKLNKPDITPFGVDISLFKKKSIKKNNHNIIKIGIVKKLEPIYGIDILIKAFNHLVSLTNIDVELHIVGEGTEREILRDLKNMCQYSNNIYFHGAIPNNEVPDFLENIDIFVVPSRSESFGVAAVEASAMELPVIVSNVGGLPEVVEDGKTGLVVPKEDPDALCNAMLKLINNESYRKKLGVAGREKVEQEYNWDKNVNDVINIYNKILSQKNN